MTDKVEQANIRTLDIDRVVRGFAETEYIFKSLVRNETTNGDSIRWYQKTAGDLTATAPQVVANISPLSQFPILEVDWTRNTSYPRKYAAEGFISMEDISSTDVQVLSQTLRDLTRAVVKQVDTRIYNVLTESQSPSDIGTSIATGTGWDDTSGGNPILDIMSGAQAITENDYSLNGYIIAMDPKNYKDLLNYLIDVKGSSIPNFSSEKVVSGVVGELLGGRIVVSNNVVADSVFVGVPNVACAWKSFMNTTSDTTMDPGIGTRIRVWESGEAILTDPKAAFLITDTNT